MEEFARMEIRQRKWMLYLLAIFLFGAAITPYERFFLGLLVGHVVSYYGLRLLQNRAKAFGRLAVDGKRTSGLGKIGRASCRERVKMSAVEVEGNRKRKEEE